MTVASDDRPALERLSDTLVRYPSESKFQMYRNLSFAAAAVIRRSFS